MEEYTATTKSAYKQNINYFGYYQNLLVYQTQNLDIKSFNKIIDVKKENQPKVFYIKHEKVYEEKLQKEFDVFISSFKHYKVQFSIIDNLKEKYGTIAQVFDTKSVVKEHPELQKFSEWIDKNHDLGFFLRFSLSSLLPYIFLDVNPNESVLSCCLNNPQVCEIISGILKDGYIFINEEDEKIAKYKYNFEYPNYCVISYSMLKIPFIEEFDKVLCIVPSTNEDKIDDNSDFSLNKAVENHQKQKKYLISALEKVKVGGICVYSSYSIDPFENEAVVNSVLQMNKYKDKFEIIDCSTMFAEMKRQEGLTRWDVNKNFFDQKDEETIQSLSSEKIVKNINNCMRFYPHQIHSNSTFIAVIKKIERIETVFTSCISQSTQNKNDEVIENQNQFQFSKVDKTMIQIIKNDYLNDSDALCNLGVCYKKGEGVEQNISKAIEYFRRSADLNNFLMKKMVTFLFFCKKYRLI